MPAVTTFKCVTAYSGVAPRTDLSDHSLIFTHIPKTGGTTLDYILLAVAATRRIPFLRALGTIYGQFHGVGKGDSIRQFESWPAAKLARLCHLSGHLPFGPHRRLAHPYFYVVLLRDPLKRLLSQYRFGIHRGGWAEATPIAEVFDRGLMADNLQTRQIAGLADARAPCTARTLQDAIARLRSDYTAVGTAERFDDFLKLLITMLGWPDVVYGNRQVTQGAPNARMIEQAQEATQRFFAYDLELYKVAAEIAAANPAKVFGASPTGSRRQAQVLVSIPGMPFDGTPQALMPATAFDTQFRPALQANGADVQFV